MHSPAPRRARTTFGRLLAAEAAGGVVLLMAAVLGLLVANSALGPGYVRVLQAHIAGVSVLHWINDGLMALFFLLVGLEIKRELLIGQLATWPRRLLPGIAALGGMAVPALLYTIVNAGARGMPAGWAIPAATDIAFALCVLTLLGARVPASLKVFLTALAILDDLGAVVIIAAFYTETLAYGALGLAAAAALALVAMNALGVRRLSAYLLLGGVLWFFMQRSGVHATVAGVLLALTIPLRSSAQARPDGFSPLHRLERALAPWAAFAIVPLFGFANAGVDLSGTGFGDLLAPVPLGVAIGLLLGKQVGVFGSSWLLIKLGVAQRPEHATWRQLYGTSVLCGIGFTMSLFIGLLAFRASPEHQDAVKIGVLVGSLLSALAGSSILLAGRRPAQA